MVLARSLFYAALFYSVTFLWVLAAIIASLFGRPPTLAVVLSWVEVHHWLAENILGIRVAVEGAIPPGPHLIAVKHQSMFETIEMVRLSHLPVIVMKLELDRITLFGLVTRRYGNIVV
jgi:1-acyl-sn-glycerol-3-phosphate acyltransferase